MPCNMKLLEAVIAWRKSKMEELKVPAYCILRKETMTDIATLQPRNTAQLLECRYMGKAKASRFGQELLDIVSDYAE